MTLAAIMDWLFSADGWVPLVQDGHNIPRGPLGVLLYLLFVPFYWFIPRGRRATYLIVSSLLLALVTLGPGYGLTLVCLALVALAVVRLFGTVGSRWLGVSVLIALYTGLILHPQPFWLPTVNLPPLKEPLYFYIHWAGIGYLFLKSLHVLNDVAKGTMKPPAAGEFLAYLLFAPTLRMGPIYRFGEFNRQLNGDIADYRSIRLGCFRIFVGLIRLGIMSVLLDRFPTGPLFEHPETLPAGEVLLGIYAAPISIYLWISGYIDLSIGLGRFLGFAVPENFNYPWRAMSIAEFWRRWHLTLGAWLRDYIYIPLGGNRRHTFLNYMITFLLCGLWHGTYPSYLCWGLSQGIGLAICKAWGGYWEQQQKTDSTFYQRLARMRLVSSPLNRVLAWLVTLHYQILTIVWFMDEAHSGRLLSQRLISLLGLG